MDAVLRVVERMVALRVELPQTPEEWDVHVAMRKIEADQPLNLSPEVAEKVAGILASGRYSATVVKRMRRKDQRRARGAGSTTMSEKSARTKDRRSGNAA